MAGERIRLEVRERERRGSADARRLRKEGGVLSQVQREINVEALPMEIPEHLELDVSGMAIGDTLRLADLPVRGGMTYLDDPEETVLATVTLPTKVEEPEPEVEEEELAE